MPYNAALTGAFALIMAATATIISVKRLSNVLLSGSVAERKSPDNRMFDRFPVNAALSGPWSDSGRVLITPASVDVKSVIKFASFCKFYDAFYGQLEALVMFFHYLFETI